MEDADLDRQIADLEAAVLNEFAPIIGTARKRRMSEAAQYRHPSQKAPRMATAAKTPGAAARCANGNGLPAKAMLMAKAPPSVPSSTNGNDLPAKVSPMPKAPPVVKLATRVKRPPA